MESTATPTLIAPGHQLGQLIARRYRLVSLHHADEGTEVWRARDEETAKGVTLEFHRDPDTASRARFLAGARRLASTEQPSVMRVAAIHDDPDGAFIVFEHLVEIPVAAEWLKAGTVEAVPVGQAQPPTAGMPQPLMAVGEAPTIEVSDEKPTDRGLSLLLFAIRTRELSLIDMPLVQESALELAELTRVELAAIRFDSTVIDDLRTFVQNVDIAAVLSTPARAIGRLFTRHPPARVAAPDAPYPTHVKKIRITPAVPAAFTKARTPRAPLRLIGRVRFRRALSQGLFGGVLATVLLTMPPEVAVKLATEATSTAGVVASEVASTAGSVATELIAGIGTLATEVSSTIGEKIAAAQPGPTLAKATFDLPPLSAYRAAFEAQAPYPTASPNAPVEWVVALRNTGSVGWYRGIDGAQASLALADGTTAGVQTTDYVGPGQVGWFVVHFAAPSESGTWNVQLLPRIDGQGSLPDLGIYVTVTVSSPNHG